MYLLIRRHTENENRKIMNTDQLKPGKNEVKFDSHGYQLSAHLYLPEGFGQDDSYPAVVVGGSLTSVKEQMAGTYAVRLAQQGIAALAFDFRNYGQSEGEQRQFEDPQLKQEDLESAVTFLLKQPFVTEVGGLGVCTAGGNMAYLAAADKRLKAFATVAAWLPNKETLPLLYGSQENLVSLKNKGAEARAQYEAQGENALIPAYSDTDTTASHVGPMEYYMDTQRGGGVKEWNNSFSVMSWEPWLAFDPMSKAANIETPAMIIHSDGSALPDNARSFYDQLQGQKELVWLEGYHFDFYDQEKQVNEAATQAGDFFKRTLTV